MSTQRQPSPEAQVFASQWARSLRGLTILSLAILVVLVVLALAVGPSGNAAWIAVILIPAILVLAAVSFFTIRRYEVRPGVLLVKRLGGTTRVDLAGLESVEADPQALDDVRRTFGDGKPSLFFNTYDSPRLGKLEAFGKQEPQAVVLRFPGRTVVVTPAEPQRMVEALDRLIER
jgi:hypothetical protein